MDNVDRCGGVLFEMEFQGLWQTNRLEMREEGGLPRLKLVKVSVQSGGRIGRGILVGMSEETNWGGGLHLATAWGSIFCWNCARDGVRGVVPAAGLCIKVSVWEASCEDV